jgi:hypothetical protein
MLNKCKYINGESLERHNWGNNPIKLKHIPKNINLPSFEEELLNALNLEDNEKSIVELLWGDIQLGKRVQACIIMWISVHILKRPFLYIFRNLTIEQKQLQDLGFTPQTGGNYVFLEPGETKQQAFDRSQNKTKTQPDVERLGTELGKRKDIQRYLQLINKKSELQELIIGIIELIDPNLIKDKSKLQSIMFGMRNRITEEEKDTKVLEVVDNNGYIKNKKNKMGKSASKVTSNLPSPEKAQQVANMPSSIYTGGSLFGVNSYINSTTVDNEEIEKIIEDVITKITDNYKLPSLEEVTNINPDLKELVSIMLTILQKEKNTDSYLAIIAVLLDHSSEYDLEPEQIKAIKNRLMKNHILTDSNG